NMENVLIDILREIENSDVSIINLSRVVVGTVAKIIKGRSVISNRLICALRDVLTKGKGRLLVIAAGNCGASLGEKYHIEGCDADIISNVFLEGQLAKIHDLKDHIIFVGALSNDEDENVLKAYTENKETLKKITAIRKFKDVLKGSQNISELAEIIYEQQDVFKKCWSQSMATCEAKMREDINYANLDPNSSTYEKDVKNLYIQSVSSLMAKNLLEAYQIDSSVILEPLQKVCRVLEHGYHDFYLRFVRQGESPYQLAAFSNKAGCALRNFISTYGEGIPSTLGKDSYALANGTSMAAPIVAGCLALLLQANPKLSPVQAWQILRDTVDSPFSNPEVHGVGSLNFKEALAKARSLYRS
ncbi:MAG TPA: S8 family serine peptidase, partial [Candidatus Nitrosotenuis sp.]|nr:S8 family serine peptidase [Candidatus Nitrosotenuis sp.]